MVLLDSGNASHGVLTRELIHHNRSLRPSQWRGQGNLRSCGEHPLSLSLPILKQPLTYRESTARMRLSLTFVASEKTFVGVKNTPDQERIDSLCLFGLIT